MPIRKKDKKLDASLNTVLCNIKKGCPKSIVTVLVCKAADNDTKIKLKIIDTFSLLVFE